MSKTPYRLLCTATPSPNDYVELGTSSEALGEMGYNDMLSRFFKQPNSQPHRRQAIQDGRGLDKGSFRVARANDKWRLKGHAELPFWRWICSWARACRTPSDLGFDDGPFQLQPILERSHIVEAVRPANGHLFDMPAVGLNEEREERRRTLLERCTRVTDLVAADKIAVVWCHLNAEGDLLERMIPGARQVKGANSDEEKEEAYQAFAAGDIRVLVIKPKIGAWGLNWQHCNHVVTFATHSYEQFYQAVRRCWRFGQEKPVTVDIVTTVGEAMVRENMSRKADQAAEMFTKLVAQMNHAQRIASGGDRRKMEMPSWL